MYVVQMVIREERVSLVIMEGKVMQDLVENRASKDQKERKVLVAHLVHGDLVVL